MERNTLIVKSGLNNKKERYVFTEDGVRLNIPPGWGILMPGDAAVTRTLKSLGPTWTAQRKKGRKTFSDGVWAPLESIKIAAEKVACKRALPEYGQQREAALKRRNKKQEEYREDFYHAVFSFLDFHERYRQVSEKMAHLISIHATPIGSGTVARTERIPINERAAAAVTAWMRHETTGYDTMRIQRVKGRRREVRRELAQGTHKRLESYRIGADMIPEECPLHNAVMRNQLSGTP